MEYNPKGSEGGSHIYIYIYLGEDNFWGKIISGSKETASAKVLRQGSKEVSVARAG